MLPKTFFVCVFAEMPWKGKKTKEITKYVDARELGKNWSDTIEFNVV